MKRRSQSSQKSVSAIQCAVMLLALFCHGALANVLFTDGFEGETVGNFPSNWTQRYSGQSITVVDTIVKSGSKALRMEGAVGWAGEIYRSASLPDGDRVLEGDVYIASNGNNDIHVCNFMYNNAFAHFRTIDTDNLSVHFQGPHLAQPFPSNTWLHVKIEVDWENDLKRVTIDDVVYFVGPFNKVTNDVGYRDISFHVSNEAASPRVAYFDNIELSDADFDLTEAAREFVLGDHCLQFDGSDDRMRLPASVLDGAGDFTVEMWLNLDGDRRPVAHNVLSCANATNQNELLYYVSNDANIVNYNDPGGNPSVHSLNHAIDDGEWHHVALTRSSDQMTLYIDGE